MGILLLIFIVLLIIFPILIFLLLLLLFRLVPGDYFFKPRLTASGWLVEKEQDEE